MQVQVNGEPQELPSGSTVAHLIDLLGLGGQRMAIEVNEEVVPRSEHATFVLNNGDAVEVVNAVGGG